MSFTSKRKPPEHPTVYAMLWVSRRSVAQISEFFVSEEIPEAIEFDRYQVITRLPPSDRLRTPLGAYFDSRN